MEPEKSIDMTHSPGHASEPRVFAKLKASLQQVKGKEAIFREEMCNGARWLVSDLLFSTQSSTDPFFEVVDAYDIYYRPCGKVTVEDVRALRDKGRLAFIRPTVVVAATEGFEAKALASIKRSEWIDYYDEHHMPPDWSAKMTGEED